MKRIFKLVIFCISFIWQLPQNIIAMIILLREWNDNNIKTVSKIERNVIWIELFFNSSLVGVSLGNFIFLREDAIKSDKQVKLHESGHVKQSWVTGWFYLLVIGIPSYFNHIRSGKDTEFRKIYYTVYPERWADLWGGVKRGKK